MNVAPRSTAGRRPSAEHQAHRRLSGCRPFTRCPAPSTPAARDPSAVDESGVAALVNNTGLDGDAASG